MTHSAFTAIARLGFAARGLVYLIIGWFAIEAARRGSQPVDNQGALASLTDEPLGQALLGIVAVGLLGYALWRLSEAAFDPERKGETMKGAFERAGYAVSGIAHVVLAFTAARLALGGGASGGSGGGASPGDASAQDWSAWLLEQPGGQLLVGLIALGLFAAAAAQLVKAYRASFMEALGAPGVNDWRTAIGRAGYAARGVVFALIGWFFLNAALTERSAEAGGMGQALSELGQASYGPLLLGVVAAGLLMFGLFSFVEARYRQVRVVDPAKGVDAAKRWAKQR